MIKKLLTAFFIIFILNINSVFAQETLKIKTVNFDNSDSIIFLGTSSVDETQDIKIVKKVLSEPDRIFFDIENAVITFPNTSYTLKNSRLTQFKIAQNSTNPNIVRLVLWNSGNYDSSQVKVLKFKNNIIIKLGNETPVQQYLTQVYRETNVSSVDYYDKAVVIPEEKDATQTESDEIFQKVQQAFKEDGNELVRPNIEQKQARLKSRFFLDKVKTENGNINISGIGVINIKKPMYLTEPSRVVYDLPNTIVLQELRDKEYKLTDSQTVKIGQFEPSVARIVINTSTPEAYTPIYMPNLQSAIITKTTNINHGTALSKLSYFKEQNINSTTNVINIIFSNPIVYSIKRESDKIRLLVYNLTEFDVSPFNMVAETNKTGFKSTQIGVNAFEFSFPVKSNESVDCYETLNASHLRFVFTKTVTTAVQKESPVVVRVPVQIPEKKSETVSKPKKEQVVKPQPKKESAAFKKIKKKVIVIDPGHGGNDTGALRGSVLEKDITLDIAKKVRDILKEKGFTKIIMTRSVDKTLSLADRVDIANSNKADIYISIHINASVKSEINGIETHYYSTSGYDVAKIMHKELMKQIDATDRGLFKSKFYVINHTEAPAVLLELGFISNDKERSSLISDKRQMDSAQAIADGIVNYLMEH